MKIRWKTGSVVSALAFGGISATAGLAQTPPSSNLAKPLPDQPAAQGADAGQADAGQTVEAASSAPDASDEIVVSGIRGSLSSAIQQKRIAASIVDTIAAEDIGAFPDTNVAESLQRVTGIQINRARGEGTSVSIRGLESKFARVLLNGDGITSTAPSSNNNVASAQNRSFDFAILAPDFIGALEVFKSPTADLEEGGLAGTVNVKTIQPLDLKGRRLNVNVQGIKNSQADKYGYKTTAIFADQFADDTIGIMAGYDRSRRFVNQQAYQSSGMERKVESAYNPANITRPPLHYVDLNRDGDITDALRLNHVMQLQNDRGTRDRETFIGSVQLRPVDGLDIRLSGLRSSFVSDLAIDYQSAQFHLNGDPNIPGNAVVDSHVSDIRPTADDVSNDGGFRLVNGQRVLFAPTPITGLIDYIDRDGVFMRNSSKLAYEKSQLATYTGAADYETDRWKFSGQGTFSRTRKNATNYGLDAARWGSVVQDYRTDIDGIPTLQFVRGTDPLDASKWFIPSSALIGEAADVPFRSKQYIASGDITYDAGSEWLTALRIGVRWARTSLDQGDRRLNVTAAQLARVTGDQVIPRAFDGGDGIAAAPYLRLYENEGYLKRYKGGSDFPRGYLAPDTRAFLGRYGRDTILSIPGAVFSQLASTYKLREETLGAYARADFGGFDERLSGNVGLRWVRTKQDSSGFSFDPATLVLSGTVLTSAGGFPISADRTYDSWLPSFNAKFDLDRTKTLRFAVSRTVTRPDYGQLSPAVGTPSFVSQTQSASNPDLDPYYSWNVDLSAEWYPTRETLVSAALFYKKISGYLVTTFEPAEYQYVNGNSAARELVSLVVSRSRPVNGSGTNVKGAELSIQQPFTFLPAPFDGLGINANYTFTDAGTIKFQPDGLDYPLTSVSKHSFNLVGYYEKGPVSLRVAYNYRSKYVEDQLSSRLDGVYIKPFGQLDASFRLTLNDALALTVDAVNLTDEPLERVNKYGFGRGYEVNGRTLLFGVRYSMF